MEGYDEIAHNIEKIWDSMCELKREKDKTSHARVTNGFSIPVRVNRLGCSDVYFTQYR
jgi:hypothetical protein